jgi:hypothetical protein
MQPFPPQFVVMPNQMVMPQQQFGTVQPMPQRFGTAQPMPQPGFGMPPATPPSFQTADPRPRTLVGDPAAPSFTSGPSGDQVTALPKPIFRGQMPVEPVTHSRSSQQSADVTLPAPEALGIRPTQPACTPSASLDWNAVHARVRQLGAVDFHLAKLESGMYRASFTLPTSDPDSSRLIEVVGESEGAAVTLALQRAEQPVSH